MTKPDHNICFEVSLLGRNFVLSCKPDEEEKLRKAVDFLKEKIEAMEHRSRQFSIERIALLAALDIAHEHLLLFEAKSIPLEPYIERLQKLADDTEKVLR